MRPCGLEAHAVLASRAGHHGGIPVGGVFLPERYVDTFRTLLQHCAGKVRFKAVDRLPGGLLLHLPPAAAGIFDAKELSEELEEFLAAASAEFYSGVRVHDRFFKREPVFPVAEGGQAFSFVEIFAGIGGFRLGLEPLGGSCMLAAEIDRSAQDTYTANFGSAGLLGDISDIYAHSIPSFDILTGGFPCQPFTNRGGQKGLADARGQLYLELVRLLKACQPRAFLFENVVGLVVMDGGSRSRRVSGQAVEFVSGGTFNDIIKAFSDCGYDVSWRVANSRHWLPQFRERVYIVGFRRDLCLEMDWDLQGDELASAVRSILEPADSEHIAAAELSPSQWAVVQRQCGTTGALAARAIPLDSKAPTLVSGYHGVSNHTSKYIFAEADGTQRDGRQGKLPRFLTPRECARLMGFPDSFQIPAVHDERGRGRFYHQIGNAVCPPVIQAVGARLLHALGSS